MEDELDSLDINLVDSDDIGCRIILLTALAIWPDHDSLDERDSWAIWLVEQGAISAATRAELVVLNDHRERELVEADLDVCGRALDALVPLAWCVAMTDELQLTLPENETTGLLDGIPIPSEKIEAFLDQLVLRDENDIALERERAEVWNWRLAAEITYRTTTGGEREDISEAIQEVVLECASTMVIAEMDGNDFLVEGVPVRLLNEEVLGVLLVASEEHLRGLNWVCGLTTWDEIHLPD